MRRFIRFALAALTLSALLSPACAADKTLNVYNWSDYIDPKVLEDFTRETGIKVVYDTYDSNETLQTKILAGNTGYDIIVPTATFMQRFIQAGVLQKLDKSKLPNLVNAWPAINARLNQYDPGNQYGVDYMWFTTGLAYNTKKIKERLGNQPINSWDILFQPDNLKKLADCGVYVLDSPEDLIGVALRYLHLNPDSKNTDELQRASELLQRLRGSVKKFHSSEYINALANSDICLAVSWSGDAFQARARAIEANNGVDIQYAVPKEGSLISLDTLVIPKDAPHVEAAHQFINFLLRPDIAARNTNVSHFANGVIASRPLIAPDIANNKAIYPDDATMEHLFVMTPYDLKTQKFVSREWTRIKTGK